MLIPEATNRKFRMVQNEGARQVGRDIDHYNLDVTISVGNRVKCLSGTQFRIWATSGSGNTASRASASPKSGQSDWGGGAATSSAGCSPYKEGLWKRTLPFSVGRESEKSSTRISGGVPFPMWLRCSRIVADPRQYIKMMRQLDPGLNSDRGTICTPLRILASDGKMRETNCANTEGSRIAGDA